MEKTMEPSEFERLKSEVDAEYLAKFKRTVTQHEYFLRRVAAHEKLSHDHDLRIFLTYKDSLEVRGQNTQEKVKGFFKTISKSADEVSLLSLADFDDFFQQNKKFVLEYLGRIKQAADKAQGW